MSSPFRHMQQLKTSNKERVKYSFDEQEGIYVRDNKNGCYGYNSVIKTFKEIPQSVPTIPVKTRIDRERNSYANCAYSANSASLAESRVKVGSVNSAKPSGRVKPARSGAKRCIMFGLLKNLKIWKKFVKTHMTISNVVNG